MYISTLTLRNPHSVQSYCSHKKLVWSAFKAWKSTPRDFIYRVEERRIVCVSPRQPVETDDWRVDWKPYEPKLRTGTRWRFVTRVNPVYRRSKGGSTRSGRFETDAISHMKCRNGCTLKGAQLEHAAMAAWFEGKARHIGFDLSSPNSFRIRSCERIPRIHVSNNRTSMRLSVDIEGTLLVTDEKNFERSLLKGIGRNRAYGCGLVLVRR